MIDNCCGTDIAAKTAAPIQADPTLDGLLR